MHLGNNAEKQVFYRKVMQNNFVLKMLNDSEVYAFLRSFFVEMAKWEEKCEINHKLELTGGISEELEATERLSAYEGVVRRFCSVESCLTDGSSVSFFPRYDQQEIESMVQTEGGVSVYTRRTWAGGGEQEYRYDIEPVENRLWIVGRWVLMTNIVSKETEWVEAYI